MKRRRRGEIVIRKPGWVFIYFIYDDNGKVIYVGQTVNENTRAARHQSAASKCKRLAAAIERLRTASSTWQFAKSYKRAPGIAHGVPEELGDKFEAFFIARAGGTGTLHSALNPSGCNMREGNNVTEHEPEFDELQQRLDALAEGENLYSEADYARRRSGVPVQLADAEREVAIVASVREVCADEDGVAPQCVEEVFQIVSRRHDAVSNVENTRSKLRELKSAYSVQKQDASAEVDRVEFAKDWNSLGSLLGEFCPNDDNKRQQECNKMVEIIHKQYNKHVYRNGEVALTADLGPLTVGVVSDTIRVMECSIKTRDDAGGVPSQSFQSKMAWCLPNSKLKGSLEDNLAKVNKLIADDRLMDYQRAQAVARREDILEAMRVEKQQPSNGSSSSS